MAVLTMAHYLYLDRSQRYSLHEGKTLHVTGVCVPVWFQKGNTSEPAPEIFCKYIIANDKTGANINRTATGWHINMPHVELVGENAKSDDPEVEKMVEEILRDYHKRIGTSERLLDATDGGVEEVEFRYYHKMEIDKKLHHVIHFVEIKTLDLLLNTLS